MGGLGNQFWQYAFGRSMSLRRNEPVQFDLCLTRPYALDVYNTKVELIKKPLQVPIVYTEPSFAFDSEVLEKPIGTAFIGYWQSPKYFFKPEVWRQELTFKEPRSPKAQLTADFLQADNTVFIHIRRGDYLNPGTAAYHGNLGHANLQKGYYKDAIDYMTEKISNPKFVIFTDDPAWCSQNLPYPVISGNDFNQHDDLYLMSQCKHGIGANSSFSWWGAWLGEHKGGIYIFPKKWFNADIDTSDLVPSRWTRL